MSDDLAACRQAHLPLWLKEAARRRRLRHARSLASIAALAIAILGLAAAQLGWWPSFTAENRPPAGLQIVRTCSSIPIVTSNPNSLTVIDSSNSQAAVATISDDELFALFPGHGVGIVGDPQNGAEFLLVDGPGGNPDPPQ